MANWKSSFRLTFYTFVMEIFWTDAGTGAGKVWVAFCQFSLRVAFPKLSFIIEHNFEKLCHKSTILQSLKIDSDLIQCNAFRILSQVLINVQFGPTYWIQLYFLALQLYRLKIGFLGYFQNFKSQFPKVWRVKVIPRTIHYGMGEIEICRISYNSNNVKFLFLN